MRVLFLSMVVFCLNWSAYAAVVSSSDSNNLVEENSSSVATFSEVVPASLYTTRMPLDGLAASYLAPIRGNEFALNLTATRFLINSSFGASKSESEIDYSLQTISIAHAFNKSLFLSASVTSLQTESKNEWTYADSDVDKSTHTSKGISEPSLTLGGRIYTDSVTTILSISNKFSTGPGEQQYTNNDDSEANGKSGGGAVIPAVTVHSNLLQTTIGGTISYLIQGDRTFKYTDKNSVRTTKATGGNIQKTSLFAEHSVNKVQYGGVLDYVRFENGKFTSDSGSTSEGSPLSYLAVSAFVKFDVSQNLKLIPSLSYGQFREGLSSEVEKKDMFSTSIMGVASF